MLQMIASRRWWQNAVIFCVATVMAAIVLTNILSSRGTVHPQIRHKLATINLPTATHGTHSHETIRTASHHPNTGSPPSDDSSPTASGATEILKAFKDHSNLSHTNLTSPSTPPTKVTARAMAPGTVSTLPTNGCRLSHPVPLMGGKLTWTRCKDRQCVRPDAKIGQRTWQNTEPFYGGSPFLSVLSTVLSIEPTTQIRGWQSAHPVVWLYLTGHTRTLLMNAPKLKSFLQKSSPNWFVSIVVWDEIEVISVLVCGSDIHLSVWTGNQQEEHMVDVKQNSTWG